MTCIAATLEGMAADRRVVRAGSFYPAQKIFRVRESLFGTAGHGDACLAFLEWVRRARRKPAALHEILGGDINIEMRDEIEVLELNPRGIFHWTGWGFPEKILAPHFAIGSGGTAALEALRNGKGLQAAVEAAMGHDEYTGCGVQLELLHPRRRR